MLSISAANAPKIDNFRYQIDVDLHLAFGTLAVSSERWI